MGQTLHYVQSMHIPDYLSLPRLHEYLTLPEPYVCPVSLKSAYLLVTTVEATGTEVEPTPTADGQTVAVEDATSTRGILECETYTQCEEYVYSAAATNERGPF